MLVSCKYCNRLHKRGEACSNRPIREKKITKADRFRWSKQWQKKRKEISERDKYLCQVCLNKKIYNYKDLSVHHIVPILSNWSLRLDNSNLICLCSMCHDMADRGDIDKDFLHDLIKDY